MSKIKEIEKLKNLLDEGALSKEQYDLLIHNIVGDHDKKLSKEEQLLTDGAISQEQYDLLIKSKNKKNKGNANQIVDELDSEYLNIKVKSGVQKWARNNLAVKNYRSGKPIKQLTNPKQLRQMYNNEIETEPHWMYYNFDSSTEKTHGLLYVYPDYASWCDFAEPGKKFNEIIAPKGLRIPTQFDVVDLFEEYGKIIQSQQVNWANGTQSNYPMREIDLKNPKCKSLLELFSPNQGAVIDHHISAEYEEKGWGPFKTSTLIKEDEYKFEFTNDFVLWTCSAPHDTSRVSDSKLVSHAKEMKLYNNDEQGNWEYNYRNRYQMMTSSPNSITFLKCIAE
jgi:hypothetical protein